MPLLIKFIAMPLYPTGLAVSLGITGIILFILRKKTALWFMIGSISVLTFFSMPFVAQMLTLSLEKPFFSKSLPDKSCSTIILLGGAGMPVAYPRKFPEINEAGDRIIHAARLQKMGYGEKIITTGTSVGSFRKTIPEAVHNAELLIEFGIDSTLIIKELYAKNTHQHAPNIKKILDSLGVSQEVVLVTSAAHMKRSIKAFKKYGYTVYPAATDFTSGPNFFDSIYDFFPAEWALRLSTAALHEYYGIIGYALLGWI
ncbi:MAG: YdcF family protein [Chitinispirillaceae bacterium]|nr:YdcF family protein [Chitinispirillaceae bacterium]